MQLFDHLLVNLIALLCLSLLSFLKHCLQLIRCHGCLFARLPLLLKLGLISCLLLGFLRFNILILEHVSIFVPYLFAFVYDSEESCHALAHLEEVVAPVELLPKLDAHQLVRLKFVFLLKKHIPQFMEFLVAFQSKLVCLPRSPYLRALSFIGHEL